MEVLTDQKMNSKCVKMSDSYPKTKLQKRTKTENTIYVDVWISLSGARHSNTQGFVRIWDVVAALEVANETRKLAMSQSV